MNLKDLNKPIDPKYIHFKPASIRKNYDGDMYAQLLAYKDARYDRMILDEVCGPENWQSRMSMDDNGVKCKIGIRPNPLVDSELNIIDNWIWREDYGDAGNFEQTKSRASDAFKRAGFQFGIGVILYNFPTIAIQLNDKEWYVTKDHKGKDVYKVGNSFRPNDWIWEVDYEGDQVKRVQGFQKFGNRKVQRFNSAPYLKDKK